MAEPRLITAAEVKSLGAELQIATATLNNDQIISAINDGAAVQVLAPTQTLDYSGLPQSLPFVITAFVSYSFAVEYSSAFFQRLLIGSRDDSAVVGLSSYCYPPGNPNMIVSKFGSAAFSG